MSSQNVETAFRTIRAYGVDNPIDDSGNTILHYLVAEGRVDLLERCLNVGADANKPGFGGMTPLMLACMTERRDVVDLLLSHGVDVNLQSRDGLTALKCACGASPFEGMYAESNNVSFTPMKTRDGRRGTWRHEKEDALGLHYLGGPEYEEMAQWICDMEVERAAETSNFACESCAHHVEVVALLLGAGALYATQEENDSVSGVMNKYAGLSELGIAILEGHHAVAEYILQHSNAPEGFSEEDLPLWAAARTGDITACDMLLDAGANPDQRDKLGQSALALATWRGYEDVVERLVKAGASIEPIALIRAVQQKHEKLVKYLLAQGADVTYADEQGNTALIHACACLDEGLVKLLIDSGSDVNASDVNGVTPLHEALSFPDYVFGHFDPQFYERSAIVRLLCEAGADVDIYCFQYGTPLNLALSTKNVPAIRELSGRNASFDGHLRSGNHSAHYAEEAALWALRNSLVHLFFELLPFVDDGLRNVFDDTYPGDMPGLNFLTYAAEFGEDEAVRGLVEYGVPVDLRNAYGSTPFLVAILCGQLRTAKLLLGLGANRWAVDYDGHGAYEHALGCYQSQGISDSLYWVRSWSQW